MLISVRYALGWQLGIIAAFTLVAAGIGGMSTGLAVIFGGAISLLNGALLLWRWYKGSDKYHCDAGRHLQSFYRSSAERFFIVGILLATGFLGLRLEPFALLAGFVVGQLAWMLASLTLRERT
jgi:hypothetical protein